MQAPNTGVCSIPVIRDEDSVMSHTCTSPQGGDKTAGVPQYVLEVTNLPDPNATTGE